MKKLAILSSLLLLALNSCSNEDIINEELTNSFEKRITVVAEDLTPAEGTRTSYTENGNGYSFAWSEGDALGIFPENGYQTAFPIGTDGVGSNTAVFDGGKWALRPNESYAAYYPLVKEFELDPATIPVDYTGQVQNGNGSTDHLGKYDFMASTFTEVDAKGNVNFKLQHLGCLVQFKLTMPKADTFSKVKITSDNAAFITEGTLDLTADAPAITTTKTSTSLYIDLQNVTTTAGNQVLTINAMFAPVDLRNSTLSVVVYGSGMSEYLFLIDGKNLTQGNVSENSKDEISIPYITFKAADTQTLHLSEAVSTLEYSVNNGEWTELGTTTVTFGGTNGDLRLRGKNASGTGGSTIYFDTEAKVSCRGDIRTLVDYENYSTANTGTAAFWGLFRNCTPLITAPELPATSLASGCYSGMFQGCTSLTTAPDLPATSLADLCYEQMFYDCISLTTAPELPATSLASRCYSVMFYGCSSLTTAPELPATSLASGCYLGMFHGCTSLVSAPTELPATSLASGCYSGMFEGCTSLVSAPELPATSLASNCYSGMFQGCTSLVSAPTELPATTLKYFCYFYMFSGCTSLTTAPDLPATSLAQCCYTGMFSNCTSLISVPAKLPATTLIYYCYEKMFFGCTSLTTAPELPATSLALNCYLEMFRGCTSLTSTPAKLPATSLAESCYSYMFQGCTSLTSTPELPATSLAESCYSYMFQGCTSLTSTPAKLPATSLTESCYSYMFQGCTSLTTAPELPATSLTESCYLEMFRGCRKLNYVKMMATDISASYCLDAWLLTVSSSGTFVKNSVATWKVGGPSGIPSGWTVETADK